ncbi:hypothetical protein RvY_13361 [Ramazzottius varieornatus]|uniref:Phenylalanine--tRNA ligase, mitochondrial n=1 Tax=Ramazzottius varieornatus TaxID=947166 RepID=A0A1D1VMM6_RAMVA|nr:hypothetical protein RvY_13361 [Ramazzottius varieornatus]
MIAQLEMRGLQRVLWSYRSLSSSPCRCSSTSPSVVDPLAVNERTSKIPESIQIGGHTYRTDSWTNVTPRISSFVGKNIYLRKNHPLWLIKERIIAYFNWRYPGRYSPAFTVVDNLSPVVTTEQNFDSILVPADHVSRSKSDSYYVNKSHLLRAHTSAHQSDLLRSGFREFLVVGDVYRRDEINATHYPVFHQMEGVRLRYAHELRDDPDFKAIKSPAEVRSPGCQESHTEEAAAVMEKDLKGCLEGLVKSLFGQKVELRWNESFFPFTHPSWEMEVKYNNEWLELLGCGIMEQKILNNAGIHDQIGWACGIGLERIAMRLYEIPDIRLFWSEDSGFLSQFEVDNIRKLIKYKAVSQFPQCTNDVSFWIPEHFEKNDFYELVRDCGGELVEQVKIIDEFTHPKSGRKSLCYRIIYRHMEKTLTKDKANSIHKNIEKIAVDKLGVQIR